MFEYAYHLIDRINLKCYQSYEMRRLEKENPEIKNWDELREIWSENCPSAKKAEMMRKKLSSFYENN
jgi:hypothetical protein